MKKILDNTLVFALVVLAAFVLFRTITGLGPAPVPAMFNAHASNFDQVVAQAQDDHKIVLAVVTADWCGPCKSYKKGTLSDPRVADWIAKHATAIHVDVDHDQDALAKLGNVTSVPTTFVLNNGKVVDRATGPMSVNRLLAMLEAAATP